VASCRFFDPVALKLLLPRFDSARPTARQRREYEETLKREAGLGARVPHSQAVAGDLHFKSGLETPSYLILPWFPAGDLAAYIEKYRNPKKAARLVAQIAEVLESARTQEIVHRDLKPSNILLDDKGQPHVADWGLGRWVRDRTTTRSLKRPYGTRRYIAPEQIQRLSNADHRSDIYSLGVILYELITGRQPFRKASSDPEFLTAKRSSLVPRGKRPRVPPEIIAVCSKCTRPKPWLRYATAEGVKKDLKRYLRGQPVRARKHTRLTDAVDWCAVQVVPLVITAVLLLSAGAAAYYRSDANTVRATASLAVAETAELRDTLEDNVTELKEARTQREQTTVELDAANAEREKQAVELTEANTEREQQSVELARNEHAALYRQALALFEQGRNAQSQKMLLQIPESARNWLWHYVVKLCLPGADAEGDEEAIADTTIFPPPGAPKNRKPFVFAMPFKRIAISHDGTLMASVGFDRKGSFLAVRDTTTHQIVKRLPLPTSGMFVPAFCPNKPHVAASIPGAIVIGNMETMEQVAKHTLTGSLTDLRYTPDGTRLVVTPAGAASVQPYLIDAASGQMQETIDGTKVRYFPDGRRRAIFKLGSPSRLIVEDLATNKVQFDLPVETHAAAGMELSPDGLRVALLEHTGLVTLCRLDAKTVRQFRAGESAWALAFSQDGRRIITGDNKGRLTVTDLEGRVLSDVSRNVSATVRDLVTCPHTNQLIVATEVDLEFINLETSPGQQSVPLKPLPSIGVIGRLNDNGRRYVGRDKSGLLVFDTESGQLQQRIEKRGLRIRELLTNGHLAVVIGAGGSLQVWDIDTGSPLTDPVSQRQDCTFCVLHPDQPLLAAVFDDDSARIFDLSSGSLQSLCSLPRPTDHLAFLPTAAGERRLGIVTKHTRDHPIRQLVICNTDSAEPLSEMDLADFGCLTAIIAHPNLPQVVLITPTNIRLIDLHEQKVMWSVEGNMQCGTLHPTEPLLVTIAGTRMHFFDTRNGDPLGELPSGLSYPNCRFDASGEHLISATITTIEFRDGTADPARASQLGTPAFLRSGTSGKVE